MVPYFKKQTLIRKLASDSLSPHTISDQRRLLPGDGLTIQTRPSLRGANPFRLPRNAVARRRLLRTSRIAVRVPKPFKRTLLIDALHQKTDLEVPPFVQVIEAQRRRYRTSGKQRIAISAVSLVCSVGGLALPVLGVLGSIGLAINGINVLQRTYQQLRHGLVTADVLVLVTLWGCVVSGFSIAGNLGVLLYQCSFLLLNHVTSDTKSQFMDVFEQLPTTVWVVVDGVEMSIPFEALTVGHVVVVRAGEMIPIDGTVLSGTATVDQHVLTGEAQPVERGVGEVVLASTIVLSGTLCIQVERAGRETAAAQIGRVLETAIDFKSTVVLRAEAITQKTVLPTLLLSAVSLPFVGVSGALGICSAHFKRRMNMVTPISILNFFHIASQQGILLKDGRSLDLLCEVDTIVFDKTGTLTEERPTVSQVYVCDDYTKDELLAWAAAIEGKQTHPIAQAIVEETRRRGLSLPGVDSSSYKVGYGLSARIDGHLVCLGSHRFMDSLSIAVPPAIEAAEHHCFEQGHSLVMIAIDDVLAGAIELQPTLRPEAQAVIQQLKRRPHIQSISIISGDNEIPTRKLAQELGVDHYFAEVLPEGKADLIAQLQAQGKSICYIGDGINDAIALQRAQVSVSLSGAATIAIDTAQIVLMDESLQQLNLLFDLAHDFRRNTNTCFGIVVVPMIVGIGGVYLAGFGIMHMMAFHLAGMVLCLGNSFAPYWKYHQFSPLRP